MPTTRSQTSKLPKTTPPPVQPSSAPKRVVRTRLKVKAKPQSEPQQQNQISDPPPRVPRKTSEPIRRKPISADSFGLIQEHYTYSLYALLVQAILWNQTGGKAARPVLEKLLDLYPDPESLATADLAGLTDLLYPIGLHNQRAKRLIKFAQVWLEAPPCKERRYVRRNYPHEGDGRDAKIGEILDENDERDGWEVAHLPGIGPYALDSYRIFYRDKLRGLDKSRGASPEWGKVHPSDKDLKVYLVWRWAREGWMWDPNIHQVLRKLSMAEQRALLAVE